MGEMVLIIVLVLIMLIVLLMIALMVIEKDHISSPDCKMFCTFKTLKKFEF